MLITLTEKSHRGQTYCKMTTRARAIHLKHQNTRSIFFAKVVWRQLKYNLRRLQCPSLKLIYKRMQWLVSHVMAYKRQDSVNNWMWCRWKEEGIKISCSYVERSAASSDGRWRWAQEVQGSDSRLIPMRKSWERPTLSWQHQTESFITHLSVTTPSTDGSLTRTLCARPGHFLPLIPLCWQLFVRANYLTICFSSSRLSINQHVRLSVGSLPKPFWRISALVKA